MTLKKFEIECRLNRATWRRFWTQRTRMTNTKLKRAQGKSWWNTKNISEMYYFHKKAVYFNGRRRICENWGYAITLMSIKCPGFFSSHDPIFQWTFYEDLGGDLLPMIPKSFGILGRIVTVRLIYDDQEIHY